MISLSIRFFLFSLFALGLCRAYLFFTYPDYFGALTSTQIAISFIKGIQFDSATIASCGAIFFLILALPFRFTQSRLIRNSCLICLSLILFLLIAYYLIDISYFGEVKRHIGAEFLNIGADIGAITAIAFSSRLSQTVIGFSIIIFLGILGYYTVIKPFSLSTFNSSSMWKSSIYCLGFVVFMVIAIRGFILQGRPINLSDAFVRQGSLEQAALILNPAYLSFREGKNRLKQKPLVLVDEPALQTFIHDNQTIFHWQKPQAHPTKKNIVFILLESWTYRYIDSLSGSSYKVTPFFDQLVQKSLVWDRYYAA